MRIAIVDDVAAERALLRSRLESQIQSRHLSVQILEFASGESFLTTAREKSFDVLFLDIYMGGISVARAINAMFTADSTAFWYCMEGGLIYNAMCFAFVVLAWYPATHGSFLKTHSSSF